MHIFKKLNILNVTDMLKLHELKLYYKHMHMTLPVYINTTVHTFNTRIHDNIHTNRASRDFSKRCIRHDIPLLINSTTFNIKNKTTTHNFRGFLSYAKDNVLQNTVLLTKLLYMWTFITINVQIYSVSFCIRP